MTATLNEELRHKWLLRLAWLSTVLLVGAAINYGLPYYTLEIENRPASSFYPILRPGGSLGIKLGILGVALFGIIFLYPLRKRWGFLARIGKTRHWLDFHILLGITAPIVITLHASFKARGLAGMAYWIMMAVAASGFVGRYLYGLIPRSVHAAELDSKEIQAELDRMTPLLSQQTTLSQEQLEDIMYIPARASLERMLFPFAIAQLLWLDLRRLLMIFAIRRGLLRSRATASRVSADANQLDEVFATARNFAWLSGKVLLLGRTQKFFHLWHVIHRPFSLAFVILVVVHITIALLFGYF